MEAGLDEINWPRSWLDSQRPSAGSTARVWAASCDGVAAQVVLPVVPILDGNPAQ
jgi:hypothetical protein